jgi:hypothetical protein
MNFHFCFCCQPNDCYLLTETCGWFCVISDLLCAVLPHILTAQIGSTALRLIDIAKSCNWGCPSQAMAHVCIVDSSCWVTGRCPYWALIFMFRVLSGATFGTSVPANCSSWSRWTNVQGTDKNVPPELMGFSLWT